MLSVVVIGKNEGNGLAACLSSVAAALADVSHEVLYVDSRSTDASLQTALAAGARCFRLLAAETTAGLGRRVGAQEASGEQILFFDGDMRLAPGFAEAALAELAKGKCIGAIGVRRDVYVRGGVADETHAELTRPAGDTALREAQAFGGALLIQKEALLKAGNWAANVVACEEAELHARLRQHGYRIADLSVPMGDHFDRNRDGRSLFQLLFNRRRLGLGQAFREAYRRGSLRWWLRRESAAVGCWLVDVLGLAGLGVALATGALWLLLPLALVQLIQVFLCGGLRGYLGQKLLLFYLPAGVLSYRTRSEGYEAVTAWS